MEKLDLNTVRSIMEEARKTPSTLENYKNSIKKAILSSAKNGHGDVFVETNAEMSTDERKEISKSLTDNGFKIKWHDIGDCDDEKIHIMWEEKFYEK